MPKIPKGITLNETKARMFNPSVQSKVFGVLHSEHSRNIAMRETNEFMAVVDGAMASKSGYGSKRRPVAERAEIEAGLQSLVKRGRIKEKDSSLIAKAIKKELDN